MKKNIEEISSDHSLRYIPGIDGLRALAVISVIISHFNQNLLPNGYLGVDIFFVISGFVISSSLANRKDEGIKVFLLSFYKRRIKRLAPALVLCVISTCILIFLFDPQPSSYLKTGYSSLLGLSNLNLYQNAIDYWGQDAKLNPFTHTWSLGVEEQFYLLFPLIMWFSVLGHGTDKGYKYLLGVVTAISLVSLIGFIFVSNINQPAAYFLMPFRFWELGAGCLLFLALKANKNFINATIGKIHSLAIIAAIIVVFYLPIKFSVQSTILVVTLTAILIACIQQKGKRDYELLATPIFVYIGLISYSLYLWHWTVLVISRWTIGIHWWSIPIQLGLTVLFAIGSYRFIEKPLRYTSWFSSRNRTFLFGMFATVLVGLMVFLSFSPNANTLYLGTTDSKASPGTSEIASNIQCGPQLPTEKKRQTIRTLGNSHSEHILPMLRLIANKCDLSLIGNHGSIYVDTPRGDGRYINKLDKAFVNLNKRDLLILSSRNRYLYSIPYLNGKGDMWIDHSATKEKEGIGLQSWLSELDIILAKAANKGVNVILFLPNVEFDEQVLPYDSICKDEWFRISPRGCNPQVSKEYLDKRFPSEFYQEIKAREKENDIFYTFNPLPIYCGEGSIKCSRVVEGINAFADTHHLSPEGAQLMADEFNLFLIENHLLN